MKEVEKWYSKVFQQEVKRLRDDLLQFCLLWGLTFGEHDDSDNSEEAISNAIQFTKREFPKHHPELDFENVFGTLFYVATSYNKNVFVVCPEINTIYTYLPDGNKHDLITPIISTLANDCLLQAHIWQTISSN